MKKVRKQPIPHSAIQCSDICFDMPYTTIKWEPINAIKQINPHNIKIELAKDDAIDFEALSDDFLISASACFAFSCEISIIVSPKTNFNDIEYSMSQRLFYQGFLRKKFENWSSTLLFSLLKVV